MSVFFLKPEERLADWKEFRESLSLVSDEDALKMVAGYWGEAPLMKHAYDPDDLPSWPGPWEMISEGDWCPYSVAVAMEFTLRLAGWDASRLKVIHIRDYEISDQKYILKIDESLALNYSVGEVTEYPNTRHDVLGVFQSDGKRYFELTK